MWKSDISDIITLRLEKIKFRENDLIARENFLSIFKIFDESISQRWEVELHNFINF